MVTARDLVVTTSEADLFASHGAALTRFATSLVGYSDAEDVVADALASLIESGILAKADNPRALAYRAVLARSNSLHRSAFRRRRRERRFATRIARFDPELQPEVIDAVLRLSPQQRGAVFLTYWEDLSPDQVGQLLGISPGTVKSHLARARSRLREVLDE